MVPFRAHLAAAARGLKTLGWISRHWRSHALWRQAAATLLAPAVCCAAEKETNTLDRWFAAQAQVQTWSADFTQTRSLKTLAEPLATPGRVWFVAPNAFRWELGRPAQTLAVRSPEQLLVIYPRLKRAERYLLTASHTGPWKDVLTLFDAGFPRSKEELERQFRVLDHAAAEHGVYKLTLEPTAAAARRVITQLRIEFSREELVLKATQFQLADGSILRNDFSNVIVNPKVEPGLLAPALEAGYAITEPLQKRVR